MGRHVACRGLSALGCIRVGGGRNDLVHIDRGGLLGHDGSALAKELVGQRVASLDGTVHSLVPAAAVHVVEQQREEHDEHSAHCQIGGDVAGKAHSVLREVILGAAHFHSPAITSLNGQAILIDERVVEVLLDDAVHVAELHLHRLAVLKDDDAVLVNYRLLGSLLGGLHGFLHSGIRIILDRLILSHLILSCVILVHNLLGGMLLRRDLNHRLCLSGGDNKQSHQHCNDYLLHIFNNLMCFKNALIS